MNNLGAEDGEVYQYLVVDSGPIIRLTEVSSLWRKAQHFYTVPAVVQEIRDAKARQHLERLPFTLVQREASREGIHAVTEFARKTGDYNSLSSVDIQVLGLLYDLEKEGCGGDMSHVRTTPKRTIGLGKLESLSAGGNPTAIDDKDVIVEMEGEDVARENGGNEHKNDEPTNCDPVNSQDTTECDDVEQTTESSLVAEVVVQPKSWASILNPNAAQMTTVDAATADFPIPNPSHMSNVCEDDASSGGQFSDADDDVDLVDERAKSTHPAENDPGLENELQSDFPSLAASLLVPYEDEGEPDDIAAVNNGDSGEEVERKLRSLQPISKSGKLYNSFKKYGDLMKPKPKEKTRIDSGEVKVEEPTRVIERDEKRPDNQSRIIGGLGFSGQGHDVEDDGEGWITSTKELSAMRAVGAFDPSRTLPSLNNANKLTGAQPNGPLLSQRAACTTTDFAMQNVILQMNLELLSVDGMKVRKLKNWVTRCGACYTVYTSSDHTGPLGKRLFCERCGSDVLQRIAASVDGKTGRLRLHLSKKYQYNLRGTKFSLPKPGSGNRFQGDLLLREDQLLMGAWSQKVKMRSGGKARDSAQSIFGNDIASNVGCHSSAVSIDDIRVGFGRRNPNASKGGRERRGKKKKSDDKACGLRRY
jgi:RNA-binding protein NOB1